MQVFQVYTGKLMQRKILSGNSSCPTAYQVGNLYSCVNDMHCI